MLRECVPVRLHDATPVIMVHAEHSFAVLPTAEPANTRRLPDSVRQRMCRCREFSGRRQKRRFRDAARHKQAYETRTEIERTALRRRQQQYSRRSSSAHPSSDCIPRYRVDSNVKAPPSGRVSCPDSVFLTEDTNYNSQPYQLDALLSVHTYCYIKHYYCVT